VQEFGEMRQHQAQGGLTSKQGRTFHGLRSSSQGCYINIKYRDDYGGRSSFTYVV